MSEVSQFVHKDYTREYRNVCYVGGITVIRGIQQMVSLATRVDYNLLIAGPFESSSLFRQVECMAGATFVT